jgi:hypothetical protein
MNLLAVVNQSKRVTDDEVQSMARAVYHQLHYDVAPAWNLKAPAVVAYHAEAIGSIPPGAYTIVVLDKPDDADALGWHSEGPEGQIFGRVFVDPVLDNHGGTLEGDLTVASVLSHEAIEAMLDPRVNLWAEGPDGKLYAVEGCDAVESYSYPTHVHGVSVMLSDFVLPAWFDLSPAPGPTHFTAQRTAEEAALKPFTLAKDGYSIVWTPGEQPTAVWGERYPEWRKQLKGSPLARTARRVG